MLTSGDPDIFFTIHLEYVRFGRRIETLDMPKIDCFEIEGLEAWFWSNDHDPPHFHIKRAGEWELKVNILAGTDAMFELQWGSFPRAKVCRQIAQQVTAHRALLLLEWQSKVNHGT